MMTRLIAIDNTWRGKPVLTWRRPAQITLTLASSTVSRWQQWLDTRVPQGYHNKQYEGLCHLLSVAHRRAVCEEGANPGRPHEILLRIDTHEADAQHAWLMQLPPIARTVAYDDVCHLITILLARAVLTKQDRRTP